MTSVAVIAHSRKSLGAGLGRLWDVLSDHGVTDPIWLEVPKNRKVSSRAREAVEHGPI